MSTSLGQKFDSVFLSIAQHCGDEDVSQLMELFFGFLARRTDFFSGQQPSQSRQSLLHAFQNQWNILDEITKKKQQEKQEKERIQEQLRKRQLEREKVKESELVKEEFPEAVVMKTVGDYEKEHPKKPDPDDEEEDEIENETPAASTSSEQARIPPSSRQIRRKPTRPEETPEEKQKREAEETVERSRLMPNSGNGCDLPNYKWTQTIEQVEVSIPLRAGFPLKSRDVVVEMSKTRLKAGIRGREPIIEGDLFAEVVINDEATWLLVDRSVLNIILPKKKKTEYWSRLITTDPEVSTKKMSTEALNFTDLEDDHKMVVEKMLHDNRAKQLGLPTSDEKKKFDIIEKIKKINPELANQIDPSQLQLPGDRNSFSFGGNQAGFF